MQIVELARSYLEQVKELVGNAHRDARRRLYEALPPAAREEVRRIQKAALFVAENALTDARREHISPSGNYKLVVTPYATGPGRWNYTQGLVYRKSEDRPIAEVQRNYCSFPYAWVEGHDRGDFLLCGEDYQGQTVINLGTGARRDTLPSEALNGFGFCWASIHPSPTGRLLCVHGCFWGAPYELKFYDFSEPMLPPWPELDTGGVSEEFFGWLDDKRAKVAGTEEFYIPLGKSESELRAARQRGEITEEDFDRYRDDDINWEDRQVGERIWFCPSPFDSLRAYVKETFSWRRDRGVPVNRSEATNVKLLLERLTPSEREALQTSETQAVMDWALAHVEAEP